MKFFPQRRRSSLLRAMNKRHSKALPDKEKDNLHTAMERDITQSTEGSELSCSETEVSAFPTTSGTSTTSTTTSTATVTPTPQELTMEERWSQYRLRQVTKLWDLTPEMQAKLVELKTRIVDIDHWKNDPFELVRFLLEKQGNLDKAEALFRKVIQWRLDENIDALLDNYTSPPLFDYFPIATLQGVDHDGDPIHLERPGAADAWGFYQEFGAEAVYQQAVYLRELDTRGHWHRQVYEPSQGRPVRQFTIVLDLQGLTRSHMKASLIPVMGRVLQMSQLYYPQFAKRIILLRAPKIFKLLWPIAQVFVWDDVKELLVLTSEDDYLEVIDRYMDRSVLPPCICPEEGRGEGMMGFETVQWEGGNVQEILAAKKEEEAMETSSSSDATTNSTIRVHTQPIVSGVIPEEECDDEEDDPLMQEEDDDSDSEDSSVSMQSWWQDFATTWSPEAILQAFQWDDIGAFYRL